MTAHENAVCNYVDDVCSGDPECALGERCIASKENVFNKVCIKICFYDAHCLGKYKIKTKISAQWFFNSFCNIFNGTFNIT